ncbi:MAG TPA: DUF6298 domain-containing protein, partial [Candidatus Sulfotelmatobacter sp.]|nr:DUF6298 domain-containing protein [Candidatus Sulfotelmatobacter sp.]
MKHFLGPLRRCAANPRYFCDERGNAIYLTGSHTWASFQEVRSPGEADFDYTAFLDMLTGNGHNYTRMWQWCHTTNAPWTADPVEITPLPWERTGPGLARDGMPKFDLDRFNEAYFARLRRRIELAGERGIYVALMMFEAWAMRWSNAKVDSWQYHPLNGENNINGVHGGGNRDNRTDLFTLDNPAILERQKAFVRKVIDTLNDLDNVLFEIINEMPFDQRGYQWHSFMVDYIKRYERTKPKQHPVGMTDDGGGHNLAVMASRADWISPGNWSANASSSYKTDPPAADGGKVIITDTDHLWGHGGTCSWAWKSFLRGLNPIFMDPWGPVPGNPIPGYPSNILNTRDYPDWAPLRRTLGLIRKVALSLDMSRMFPRPDLTFTGYCLSDVGNAYVAYAPEDQTIHLTVAGPAKYTVRWIMVRTMEECEAAPVEVNESERRVQ